jgi:beta-mannosidase
MKYSAIVIILITVFNCQTNRDTPVVIDLNEAWLFKAVNASQWQSAKVPGNIHSDLLDHNLIKNPFIGTHEDSLQWISETDWEYKTKFSLDKKTLNKEHITLKFNGLDTYASVFLNNCLILKTNNAFKTFEVDVTSTLTSTNNLRIVFEHNSITEEKEKAKLPYSLPEGNRIFTRKAQFQYGWDWGPTLNTSGIWRAITLQAWNTYNIENCYIEQLELQDKFAHLAIHLEEKSNLITPLNYDIYVNDKLQQTYTNKKAMPDGISQSLNLTIKNPKLWWPQNLGTPYLYDIKIIIRNNQTVLDSISVKKGLRTIELVTEKDRIGESFYFKVNDIPVYAKGANYIPQNSLQNKVTDADYNTLLDAVVDANMNMLRVWGGGIYENSIFYELCDEKGILVWQDFMFACAMYPGDKSFLNNVSQEARQNVKRLRNHSSIALWCGNNENSEGWKRWGWQGGKNENDKKEIWSNYLKVFDSILPNTVSEFTDVPYWESSPRYGRGNPKYKTEGDAHDWWVWHDAYPFEHLEKNVPRFMSEFGFQSFPNFKTIQYMNQNDTIDITSTGFKNHQKHVRGFELIKTYMTRDFPTPKNAEDYVYVSQLLQAYGITKGIEAHRRAKPYNMGSLYWQLNDCWPAISWSSIDFLGQWKALHYQAKKSFENIITSTAIENDTLKTYAINDSREQLHMYKQSQIISDFDGNILWKGEFDATLDTTSSLLVHALDLKRLDINHNEVFITTTLNGVHHISYLVKPKALKLKEAPISQRITKIKNGFKITLKSTTLQKNIFLYTKEKGHFNDNYFDLLPNNEIDIEFTSDAPILNDLKLKSLNDLL